MRIRAALVLSLLAAPALAADWPDLRGTWKGTSRAVTMGEGGHYGATDGKTPVFSEVELTIEFTDQKDGRLFGTISSAHHREPKLAVISVDQQLVVTADGDGQSVGKLIDDDHLELCYTQTSSADSQMIASCVLFERQRGG
ncbi:hypothetical protein [Geminicoccus roseus]|uniref:hypothetical protein n=1 Tax=Geminicoccus roseus TaxID=404900 RepID=UPI00040A038E|nr:hypothetical protein [Geminicoccus roseus]